MSLFFWQLIFFLFFLAAFDSVCVILIIFLRSCYGSCTNYHRGLRDGSQSSGGCAGKNFWSPLLMVMRWLIIIGGQWISAYWRSVFSALFLLPRCSSWRTAWCWRMSSSHCFIWLRNGWTLAGFGTLSKYFETWKFQLKKFLMFWDVYLI